MEIQTGALGLLTVAVYSTCPRRACIEALPPFGKLWGEIHMDAIGLDFYPIDTGIFRNAGSDILIGRTRQKPLETRLNKEFWPRCRGIDPYRRGH